MTGSRLSLIVPVFCSDFICCASVCWFYIFQLLRSPTNQDGQASWCLSTRQLWIEFMQIMCTTFEFLCLGALAGNWQYIIGVPTYYQDVICGLFGQLKSWCVQLAAFLAKIPMFYLLYCVQSGALLRCCCSLVSERKGFLQSQLLPQCCVQVDSFTFSSLMFMISNSFSICLIGMFVKVVESISNGSGLTPGFSQLRQKVKAESTLDDKLGHVIQTAGLCH